MKEYSEVMPFGDSKDLLQCVLRYEDSLQESENQYDVFWKNVRSFDFSDFPKAEKLMAYLPERFPPLDLRERLLSLLRPLARYVNNQQQSERL